MYNGSMMLSVDIDQIFKNSQNYRILTVLEFLEAFEKDSTI